MRTQNLDEIVNFYCSEIGMTIWLEQTDVKILRFGNMLIGFHQQDTTDTDSLLTFFYQTTDEVDQVYGRLKSLAVSEPKENTRYNIYNFFAKDPEGRMMEFQKFLHDIDDTAKFW